MIESLPTRSRSGRVWVLLLVLALVAGGGYGATRVSWDGVPWSSSGVKDPGDSDEKSPGDSDADGLQDELEESGWATKDGTRYATDPGRADTDADGLTDLDEAGELVAEGTEVSAPVFAGYSNPLRADTDGDDLGDADEADLDLDPDNPDTDGDRLEDGLEVKVVGSAPDLADTDGDTFDDGYEDANREKRGLNPLWGDVKVSKRTYTSDFAKGSLAGDLWREDSLAWLAGNLTSGAASSIPVIGSVVGGLADLRDVIGSAIHADWVGSGFSAAGVVPGGDLLAIPGKAAKFVARNPELAAAVAAIIVASRFPEKIQIKASKRIWKDWGNLKQAGASDKALLRLEKGPTNLKQVATVLKRSTPVEGPKPKFFPWQEAEIYLEDLYGVSRNAAGKQVSASTSGCVEVCNSFRRRFDVVADGVAHESKVGFQAWSPSIEKQIRSDAWLSKNGDIKGCHWHFFASNRSNTIGASSKVFKLLEEVGCPYTIHLQARH